MDEIFAFIMIAWLIAGSIGAIDNALFQTPDNRIVKMCTEKGYLNVGQVRITCSVDKKD
jgi:capsular polysaccharide biosynthesis protein